MKCIEKHHMDKHKEIMNIWNDYNNYMFTTLSVSDLQILSVWFLLHRVYKICYLWCLQAHHFSLQIVWLANV
jgi:hypothetical protein